MLNSIGESYGSPADKRLAPVQDSQPELHSVNELYRQSSTLQCPNRTGDLGNEPLRQVFRAQRSADKQTTSCDHELKVSNEETAD